VEAAIRAVFAESKLRYPLEIAQTKQAMADRNNDLRSKL